VKGREDPIEAWGILNETDDFEETIFVGGACRQVTMFGYG
jgi:hypothetical protein